ncbi:MAG: type II toxin-antitoxin system RelE/ParE family toxin [Chitinophagaceae bacterium]|jgi:plasmid stabilization system protein ParE|nr:type II toxin-antitoxin system RelE/ParE family toxin [Chitinophagaceae bacterium]
MALRKKEVILSPVAKEDLEKIYAYLFDEWGEIVLKKFATELNDFLTIVAYHPQIFAYLNKSLNIRKYTLYKHNLVVYKNSKTQVEIVAILNAHESPVKIKKKLKQRLK